MIIERKKGGALISRTCLQLIRHGEHILDQTIFLGEFTA